MYHFLPIALQLLLISTLDIHVVLGEEKTLAGLNELHYPCSGHSVSSYEHRQQAKIVTRCPFGDQIPMEYYGIIISPTSVLLDPPTYGAIPPDVLQRCSHTVHVYGDNASTGYEAKYLTDDNVELFKLKAPFPAASQVKPFELVEDGQDPKPGDQASVIALIEEDRGERATSLRNVTLIGPQDCEGEANSSWDYNMRRRCDDYLWFKYDRPRCENKTRLRSLVASGKLVGFRSMTFLDQVKTGVVEVFLKVSRLRSSIKKLGGL